MYHSFGNCLEMPALFHNTRSWLLYLTNGWVPLMHPAYKRVCFVYYYPFLVKEERKECRECRQCRQCRQIRKVPRESPQKSSPKCLHYLHYLLWPGVRGGSLVGYRAITFRWNCGVGRRSEVFPRLFRAKPVPPVPDSFIAYIHSTLMKQVLYISKWKWESHI